MAEENTTAAVQTEAPAAAPTPGTAAPTTEPAPPPSEPPKPEPKPEPAQPEPGTKPTLGSQPAEEAPKAAQKESKAPEKSPEVALLEGKVHALSAGVKPEMVDDVLTLAKAGVKEGVTLEQAIDGVLDHYSFFKGAAPTITSSVPTGNDEAKASDDEFVNRIMGIK